MSESKASNLNACHALFQHFNLPVILQRGCLDILHLFYIKINVNAFIFLKRIPIMPKMHIDLKFLFKC